MPPPNLNVHGKLAMFCMCKKVLYCKWITLTFLLGVSYFQHSVNSNVYRSPLSGPSINVRAFMPNVSYIVSIVMVQEHSGASYAQGVDYTAYIETYAV